MSVGELATTFVSLEGDALLPDEVHAVDEHREIVVPTLFSPAQRSGYGVRVSRGQRVALSSTPNGYALDVAHDTPAPCIEISLLCAHVSAIAAEARQIYTLHATAVSDGEAAIVLCGPAMSGKTTVALLLEQRGMPMISSNQTLIRVDASEASVVGGTRLITVRRAATSLLGLDTDESPDVDGREQLVLEEMLRLPIDAVPVRAFVFLTAWPGGAQMSGSPVSAVQLFTAMSEMPRLSVVVGEEASWPLDTAEATRCRVAVARKIAQAHDVCEVAGSASEVADLLARSFGR